MEVEEGRIAGRPVNPVPNDGRGSHHRTRARFAGEKLDLAVQDEEAVEMVVVSVRIDALPAGRHGELQKRQLRSVGEDRDRPVAALESLALAWQAVGCIARWPAAVLRRIPTVPLELPLVARRPQEVGEATVRRVEVEVDGASVALVPERVHDVRWGDHDGSGRRSNDVLGAGAEPELDLALDDVERVGVLPVNVRVGAALSGLVPRPRHDELRLVDDDADVPRLAIADRLALAGA